MMSFEKIIDKQDIENAVMSIQREVFSQIEHLKYFNDSPRAFVAWMAVSNTLKLVEMAMMDSKP